MVTECNTRAEYESISRSQSAGLHEQCHRRWKQQNVARSLHSQSQMVNVLHCDAALVLLGFAAVLVPSQTGPYGAVLRWMLAWSRPLLSPVLVWCWSRDIGVGLVLDICWTDAGPV